MLITCLFSLSAILAPVLIAIYILQHLTLGKEPTLIVPNWQSWAVKPWTICCLPRGARSALGPVPVCLYVPYVCVCMPARTCVCAPARTSPGMQARAYVCAVCACAYTCACVCERDWERREAADQGFFPFCS